MRHTFFAFLIVAGDYDGVINSCAQLDGVYNQIAQEVKGLSRQRGEGEINPDTYLDYHKQKDRQIRELESKQKAYYDKK